LIFLFFFLGIEVRGPRAREERMRNCVAIWRLTAMFPASVGARYRRRRDEVVAARRWPVMDTARAVAAWEVRSWSRGICHCACCTPGVYVWIRPVSVTETSSSSSIPARETMASLERGDCPVSDFRNVSLCTRIRSARGIAVPVSCASAGRGLEHQHIFGSAPGDVRISSESPGGHLPRNCQPVRKSGSALSRGEGAKCRSALVVLVPSSLLLRTSTSYDTRAAFSSFQCAFLICRQVLSSAFCVMVIQRYISLGEHQSEAK
jgi:hypothetical protein